MHAALAGFPLLPCAIAGMNECGGFGLSKARSSPGLLDRGRQLKGAGPFSPAPVGMINQWLSCPSFFLLLVGVVDIAGVGDVFRNGFVDCFAEIVHALMNGPLAISVFGDQFDGAAVV